MARLREHKTSSGVDTISYESLIAWNQMKNTQVVNVPLSAVE